MIYIEKNQNNVINIGQDKTAPNLAFGDDSAHNEMLVFAYVVTRRARAPIVLRKLRRLKRKFGIPPETSIHCRVLFNEHQRTKVGLSHITIKDAKHLVHHIITLINDSDLLVKYGFARPNNWKQIFEGKNKITLNTEAGDSPIDTVVKADPKGIIGMLAQSCWTGGYPQAKDCEIFISKDSTKVNFLGPNKRQAHNWSHGFSDVGAGNGSVFYLKPSINAGIYEPFFELADVVAYSLSHSLHGKEQEPFFYDLISRIRSFTKSELLLHPPSQN